MSVKQILVTSHPPNSDKNYVKSESHFDRNGNKTEFKEFKKGKILIWEQYCYDNNNRLLELIKYSGDSYNTKDYKSTSTKFQYDKHGNVLADEKWIEEEDNNGIITLSCFYLNGTIKCRKFIGDNGKYLSEYHYKKEKVTRTILYNEHGNIVEIKKFSSDGQPLNYTINTYNSENQLSKIKSVSRTGYMTEDRVLKYNDKGLLVEDIDSPVNPENAHADVLDSSNGYSRKYFYNSNDHIEIENLYLCGELIVMYRYNYTFW